MPEAFLFISCSLITLGLMFVIIGAILIKPAMNSRNWVTTPGEVIKAPGAPAPKEEPVLGQFMYRYQVSGKEYTGTRVNYGEANVLNSFRPTSAAAAQKGYQLGQTVTVYYDPTVPDRSVLEPGAPFLTYIPFGIGAIFFLLGLITSIAIFM